MSEPNKPLIAPRPDDLGFYNGTDDAIKLINERYRRRDGNGEFIETTEDMFWRVAYHIASADKKYNKSEEAIISLAKQFYGLMARREFFPNAPTLYNAGTGNGLQFSACFVLPVEDSIEGIYDSLKSQALIQKSGGGTGFSGSKLRAKDALVETTRGKSSGPISFLRVYDASTENVKQGGTRRGANMWEMDVHHPDILEFIQCKSVLTGKNITTYNRLEPFLYSKKARNLLRVSLLETQIANFNISVAATDAFMKAVKENTDYDLINPKDNSVVGQLNARMVFDLIVRMAWESGDPGLWFIDKTNQSSANPIPSVKRIIATNPCGEQPLFDYDVCNLGSINLANFVKKANNCFEVDWELLENTTRLAVRFLDNVIEMNPYPLPQITDLAHKIRRIGLGIMGWADMLAYLNIPYATIEGCDFGKRISKYINEIGHNESERLAEERGPFPLWDKSIYKDNKPIRNCTVTTIAPTGEIRILAGCSGGIEPYYGLTEVHRFEGRVLCRYQPGFTRFLEIAKERGFYSASLEEDVKNRGCVGDIDGIPEDVKQIFVTAHEIDPEWHVRMQAAFQENTDNGVSKTINLPNSAKPEDIEKVYWLAYETGCLGITVFRDGCKGQVLTVGIGGGPKTRISKDFIRSRPELVLGSTERIDTPDGSAFVTINFDAEIGPSDPFEVFIVVTKPGTDTAAEADALGRAASLILRIDSVEPPIRRLMRLRDQFQGIGGSRIVGFGENKVTSLPDGIAKAIDIYLQNFGLTGWPDEQRLPNDKKIEEVKTSKGNRCPDCHLNKLIHEEGCTKCTNCGYTTC